MHYPSLWFDFRTTRSPGWSLLLNPLPLLCKIRRLIVHTCTLEKNMQKHCSCRLYFRDLRKTGSGLGIILNREFCRTTSFGSYPKHSSKKYFFFSYSMLIVPFPWFKRFSHGCPSDAQACLATPLTVNYPVLPWLLQGLLELIQKSLPCHHMELIQKSLPCHHMDCTCMNDTFTTISLEK